jgi:hypothetical protein
MKKYSIQKNDEKYLLVWRGWLELGRVSALLLDRKRCKYCSAPINEDDTCNLCGWGYHSESFDEFVDGFLEEGFRTKERILRAFKLTNADVALAELGTYLKTNFSDIYSLDPYRFEDLMGDVFKRIGYNIEMTKRSRDGGVDLFFLSGAGDRIGIIQCKRYKKDRKVDVSLVSQLLGTQLAFDIRKAILVTTSAYTSPARIRAQASGVIKNEFEVELLDATDILRMLQVYNERLPRLEKLSDSYLKSHGLIIQK